MIFHGSYQIRNFFRSVTVFSACVILGCAAKPQVIIDKTVIKDTSKYELDLAQCKEVAEQYDLTTEAVGNTAYGGAIGGTAVAGIAAAIAGAVFAPAIPFIVAGAVTGAGIGGGVSKSTEYRAHEKIMNECLKDRGYSVYSAN
ncbi:MAG: hypothetical protein Q8R51_05000 [Azonexus sp.]|nr:hypothetical protein [Azonexus sp.]